MYYYFFYIEIILLLQTNQFHFKESAQNRISGRLGGLAAEADGERIRQVTLCQTRGEYAHINNYTNK